MGAVMRLNSRFSVATLTRDCACSRAACCPAIAVLAEAALSLAALSAFWLELTAALRASAWAWAALRSRVRSSKICCDCAPSSTRNLVLSILVWASSSSACCSRRSALLCSTSASAVATSASAALNSASALLTLALWILTSDSAAATSPCSRFNCSCTMRSPRATASPSLTAISLILPSTLGARATLCWASNLPTNSELERTWLLSKFSTSTETAGGGPWASGCCPPQPAKTKSNKDAPKAFLATALLSDIAILIKLKTLNYSFNMTY